MAKTIFCAVCGKESPIMKKALPSQTRIINIVEPHECNSVDFVETIDAKDPETIVLPEVGKTAEEKKSLDEIFDSFSFVKKLNKEEKEAKTVFDETGDKRDKKHLREELPTSNVPRGIASNVRVTDSRELGDDPRTISEE